MLRVTYGVTRHVGYRRATGAMKLESTQIICVALQKGGCTKTTTTCTLAAAAALEGYTVCIVDTDRQCNATSTFIEDADELQEKRRLPSISAAFVAKAPADALAVNVPNRLGGRLHLVASDRGVDTVRDRLEIEIREAEAGGTGALDSHEMRLEHLTRLKKSLHSLRGKMDLVFIDTPPDLGFLTTSALIAADWVLIPLTPSKYDIAGLQAFMTNLTKVRRNFNVNLQVLGILLSRIKKRVKLDRELRDRLAERFRPQLLFSEDITDSALHRQALANGVTIFEYATRSEAAVQQYLAVLGEVIERVSAPAALEAANA